MSCVSKNFGSGEWCIQDKVFTFTVTLAVGGMCRRETEIIEITHHIIKCLTRTVGLLNSTLITVEATLTLLIMDFIKTDKYSQRMNPNDFSDSSTFTVAPP